jgi:hypothetical protein
MSVDNDRIIESEEGKVSVLVNEWIRNGSKSEEEEASESVS